MSKTSGYNIAETSQICTELLLGPVKRPFLCGISLTEMKQLCQTAGWWYASCYLVCGLGLTWVVDVDETLLASVLVLLIPLVVD